MRESYPLLRCAARKPEVFDAMISIIRSGLAGVRIRKVEFDDAKSALGVTTDHAWKANVAEPFFYAGQWEQQDRALYDLYCSAQTSSLHGFISLSKKLERYQGDGAALTAMRAVTAEAYDLALAAAELKPLLTSGRAPKAAPAAINPNKHMGTCSCCIRTIAVRSDAMAHHGYTRPGYGVQTSSCSGIRFPPLEKSTEGLIWSVNNAKKMHAYAVERQVHYAQADCIKLREKAPVAGGMIEVAYRKGDPDFLRKQWGLINQWRGREAEALGLTQFLEEHLIEWTAWHEMRQGNTDHEPESGPLAVDASVCDEELQP